MFFITCVMGLFNLHMPLSPPHPSVPLWEVSGFMYNTQLFHTYADSLPPSFLSWWLLLLRLQPSHALYKLCYTF